MKVEEIEGIIGKDGKVRLQTSGFSGDSCLEATEALEALLGNGVIQRERTAEAWDKTPVQTSGKVNIRF